MINLFYSKIIFPETEDECWIWGGSYTSNQRPRFSFDWKEWAATKFNYIIHHNFINIDNRYQIVQMCDNPKCVNPKHLQLHGLTNTRHHKIYEDMVARILRSNHRWYYAYGGRGIDMDPRYNPDIHLKGVGFLNFYNDLVKLGYKQIPSHLSIDRIDNNKGYWPNNIKFSTAKQQANNRRK